MSRARNNQKNIYICHTFYHVYVAFLKEMKRKRHENDKYIKADIMLSTMSNDFGLLKERMEKIGFFDQIIIFNEKNYTEMPQLLKYKEDRGNIVLNMFHRMKFCKLLGKEEAQYVPTNLRLYKDIYVFCDSDPIGYYLNYAKIKYHALEDGLDCISSYDSAHFDNRGAFTVKSWMSKLNLIFIQNGFSKYCIDMEVNNISIIKEPCKKYIEEPRLEMVAALTEEDKWILVHSFLSNADEIQEAVVRANENHSKKIMILTEPLCELDVRKDLFSAIVNEYCGNAMIFIKPHPRDVLDYSSIFPNLTVLDKKFPMEMLNFIEGFYIDKVYSVLTEMKDIAFAAETERLGKEFLERFEAPEKHQFLTK